ncbi:hypothetical protein [Pseudomonas oryzae]|uniref:Lipoprotein n=1 Tax=Pseudomonas oryzae TaxID=1392877 RepID=A0A1H1XP36_9PSED|nr:hypothetical protein [Pseudomonas oryzae]SDT10970.1 hypothetical protein SAMN05216221_3498 [Pseudomonas oryzae]
MLRSIPDPASPPARRLLCAGLCLALSLQSGCAGLQQMAAAPDTRRQADLGRVAVIAAGHQPDIHLEGFARNKLSGAASSAGSTFVHCLEPIGQSHCSGDFCGAVLILWFGVCGVAGMVGGVVGAVKAPSGRSVHQAEGDLHKAVEAGEIQEALRRQVEQAAVAHGDAAVSVEAPVARAAAREGDYRPLADSGVDSVLEVALSEVTTLGPAIDQPLQLLMQARVRLIRTADNRELRADEFLYQGERNLQAQWAAGGGTRLVQALQAGYAALGTHIHEHVFMLYPFPDRRVLASDGSPAAFGLAPVAPPSSDRQPSEDRRSRQRDWSQVASLRPTLRWQAFPRPGDVRAAAADMQRIDGVRYDLLIAEERHLAPARIVYRSEGLDEPSHTLLSPLSPRRHYFWSVRARFTLDGRERVTEWSASQPSANNRLVSPSQHSYRFRTP